MTEHRKKLNLSTPYNTLLRHVWNFKKSTSELDKQNMQLKSKIHFRMEGKSPNNLRSKSRVGRRIMQIRYLTTEHGEQITPELLEKLQQLKSVNSSLKAKLKQQEGQKKSMVEEVSKIGKLKRRLVKIQKVLAKNHAALKKQKMKKKKRGQSKPSYEGATKEVLQDHIEAEEEKFNQLNQKLDEYDGRIAKASMVERKLGKEIIDLIEKKNQLKKILKAQAGNRTSHCSRVSGQIR